MHQRRGWLRPSRVQGRCDSLGEQTRNRRPRRGAHRSVLAAGAALCLLTAGCGADSPFAEPAPPAAGPAQVAAPLQLEVPAIDASSDLIGVGLTEDGAQEVPPLDQPGQAAYFRNAPEPGEPGAAIIVGHINGNGVDGVFARLDQLQDGDEVGVDDRTFVVYDVQRVPKGEFPRDEVYGPTDTPELRLITCGGEFDAASGDYDDNVIAYAREV